MRAVITFVSIWSSKIVRMCLCACVFQCICTYARKPDPKMYLKALKQSLSLCCWKEYFSDVAQLGSPARRITLLLLFIIFIFIFILLLLAIQPQASYFIGHHSNLIPTAPMIRVMHVDSLPLYNLALYGHCASKHQVVNTQRI